jgi:glycerol-3-phosphate dehydrogenase subunit B
MGIANKSTPAAHAGFVDVLVIGGGLAGLVSAWRCSGAGLSTKLITRGWGATHWNAGCIDVLGYLPEESRMVDHPSVGIEWLRQHLPSHPYSLAGTEAVEQVLDSFKLLCEVAEYPFFGSLDQNWLLPSSLGAARPTCLVPKSMTAGDLRLRDPMLLVGFDQFLDFYPALAAENIRQLDVPAEELTSTCPALRNLRFVSPSVLPVIRK